MKRTTAAKLDQVTSLLDLFLNLAQYLKNNNSIDVSSRTMFQILESPSLHGQTELPGSSPLLALVTPWYLDVCPFCQATGAREAPFSGLDNNLPQQDGSGSCIGRSARRRGARPPLAQRHRRLSQTPPTPAGHRHAGGETLV